MNSKLYVGSLPLGVSEQETRSDLRRNGVLNSKVGGGTVGRRIYKNEPVWDR